MYSLPQLRELILSGEVEIDLNGHNTYNPANLAQREKVLKSVRESLAKSIENRLQITNKLLAEDRAAGKEDSFWEKEQAYQLSEKAVQLCRNLQDVTDGYFCFICGRRPVFYLRDASTLSLRTYGLPEGGLKIHYDESPCAFATGVPASVVEIDVPSGELVFVNFFRGSNDAPEGKGYTEEYDLCSVQGRYNIAKHLAGQNIGFGQMTNTSIDILHTADAPVERIHIFEGKLEWALESQGEKEEEEKEEEEKDEREEEGEEGSAKGRVESLRSELENLGEQDFRSAGGLHCEMWRWMCADATRIETGELEPSENQEAIRVRVAPGRWRVSHFFDQDRVDTRIAATLERVGEN